MAEIIEALANRRARRAFDPGPVPADVQEALWRAVSVAPSHGNSQATRLLVASVAETHERLVAALSDGNRGWAAPAPLLAAVASLPAHDPNLANRDGSEREMWRFHAGIAMGNLLAQATSLGLLAHPMGGFDEAAAREAFGAPAELRVLAIVAIGYPGDAGQLPEDLQRREATPQVRLPLSILVAQDRWSEENGTSFREWRTRQ